MPRKSMKKSEISKKLGANGKTIYDWSIRLEKNEDWYDW